MPIKTQSYWKSSTNIKEKILKKQDYTFYAKTIGMYLSNMSEIYLGIAYALDMEGIWVKCWRTGLMYDLWP